jgi:hypothetical protein
MRQNDRSTGLGSVVEIACECGRSGCGEVIALPWCVYERAQRPPGQLVLAPGHHLPGNRRRLTRYDSFVVVSREEGKGEDRGEQLR